MDNDCTHNHTKVKEWLVQRPRFHPHFIPTYASWIHQVDHFFGMVIQKAIRCGPSGWRPLNRSWPRSNAFVKPSPGRDIRRWAWTLWATWFASSCYQDKFTRAKGWRHGSATCPLVLRWLTRHSTAMACSESCRCVAPQRSSPKGNRKNRRSYDREACKWRHRIESFFARIQDLPSSLAQYLRPPWNSRAERSIPERSTATKRKLVTGATLKSNHHRVLPPDQIESIPMQTLDNKSFW